MKILIALALVLALTSCKQGGDKIEILECWNQQDVRTYKEQAYGWTQPWDSPIWKSYRPNGTYTPAAGERCVVQS